MPTSTDPTGASTADNSRERARQDAVRDDANEGREDVRTCIFVLPVCEAREDHYRRMKAEVDE